MSIALSLENEQTVVPPAGRSKPSQEAPVWVELAAPPSPRPPLCLERLCALVLPVYFPWQHPGASLLSAYMGLLKYSC